MAINLSATIPDWIRIEDIADDTAKENFTTQTGKRITKHYGTNPQKLVTVLLYKQTGDYASLSHWRTYLKTSFNILGTTYICTGGLGFDYLNDKNDVSDNAIKTIQFTALAVTSA